MGWRILKGEWKHALLWGWTAFYFIWQSLQFNPTMRYQLPIYPLLAMAGAWLIIRLWDDGRKTLDGRRWITVNGLRSTFAGFVGVLVLIATAAWAYAFHTIYVRDETRIAASRWIYQNIPGPVNVHIQTVDGGTFNQPLPLSEGSTVQAGVPFETTFSAYA